LGDAWGNLSRKLAKYFLHEEMGIQSEPFYKSKPLDKTDCL